MDLGIAGYRAIVCASSRGIGKGCAIALAEAGCNIVINGRDGSALLETAKEIRGFGVNVEIVKGDVSEQSCQERLLAACPEPDILINNNGGPPRRDFRTLKRDDLVAGVTQNMIAPIEMISRVIDGMAERGFGRIVNITSLAVYQPVAGLDLSSGARAGLTAFLSGIARTVIDRNVTINNLLPGKIDTSRLDSTFPSGADIAAGKKQLATSVPAKRLGTVSEFGNICAFLCSQHAGYMTAQNIPIDGGLYVSSF